MHAQVGLDLPGHVTFDIGFSTWSEHPDALRINTSGSRTFNMYYLFEKKLKDTKVALLPGIGFGFDSYAFENNIVFSPTPDQLLYAEVDADTPEAEAQQIDEIKRSLLKTSSIDIPLELRYRSHSGRNSLRVSLGGKVGYILSSGTKLKYDDVFGEGVKLKYKGDLLFERLRYGAIGRFGFGSFNFWAYYGINSLFEENAFGGEPIPNTLTFGFSLMGL